MSRIPELVPRKRVGCGEGPTDFRIYAKPRGTVKAVMVFVDFPDAPGPDDRAKTADHLLGGGDAQRLFHEQSFRTLSLDVRVKDKLGWKRMPRPSTDYGDPAEGHHFTTFEQHRRYITDAASLFSKEEVKFRDFQFVFIVAPKAAAFPLSPAFTAPKGQGARAQGGEIRLAVTFGKDSYTNSFVNLVHEVGHLFGLPDLYPPGEGADDSRAGCWSLMSDIFRSSGFLGWHRHKNGWLPASRTAYIPRSARQRFTLAPLSAGSGTAMVVAPVDDARRPSKVFVVEVAQPRAGRNGGDGVLLYVVDANVDSQDFKRPADPAPIQVVPRKPGKSLEFGNLFEAAYRVGDESTPLTLGRATLSLRVLGQNGSSFDVEVRYDRT